MKVSGATYQQIADQLGYQNRGTVHRLVQQALEAREAEDISFYRQVELDRLNALQAALWDRAMTGDIPAVKAVLRILEDRCRLMGVSDRKALEEPARDWPCCQGPATVIIRVDDCRHEGCPTHGKFP